MFSRQSIFLGYSSIWINQDIPNSNWLISSIKLRLHDQSKQGWYSLIEHSPKALNYRIFKENFEFENYFRILEDKDIMFTFHYVMVFISNSYIVTFCTYSIDTVNIIPPTNFYR
jgi:hypothetical protein